MPKLPTFVVFLNVVIAPLLTGALMLILFFPTMKAEAQQRLRRDETYCLQSSDGGVGGGGMSLHCYYATLAQCMASRTANGDWCMENPVIGFSKRQRNYDRW